MRERTAVQEASSHYICSDNQLVSGPEALIKWRSHQEKIEIRVRKRQLSRNKSLGKEGRNEESLLVTLAPCLPVLREMAGVGESSPAPDHLQMRTEALQEGCCF